MNTGSIDQTISIAQQYNAKKIYYDKWENDFSKARNKSIEHASGDWILIIDCDEYLENKSMMLLEKLMCDKIIEAYWVKIISLLEGDLSQTSYNLRLFRNKKKEYHYKGKKYTKIYQHPLIKTIIA